MNSFNEKFEYYRYKTCIDYCHLMAEMNGKNSAEEIEVVSGKSAKIPAPATENFLLWSLLLEIYTYALVMKFQRKPLRFVCFDPRSPLPFYCLSDTSLINMAIW
jgi:hypothetical protein